MGKILHMYEPQRYIPISPDPPYSTLQQYLVEILHRYRPHKNNAAAGNRLAVLNGEKNSSTRMIPFNPVQEVEVSHLSTSGGSFLLSHGMTTP